MRELAASVLRTPKLQYCVLHAPGVIKSGVAGKNDDSGNNVLFRKDCAGGSRCKSNDHPKSLPSCKQHNTQDSIKTVSTFRVFPR